MPQKLKVPAAHQGGKETEVALDVKTVRRMLAWVNTATRPQDLMRPPEVLTHLHVEYRKPGFPERHPPAHEEHEEHEKNDKDAEHANEELATEILNRRDENPVYGFLSPRAPERKNRTQVKASKKTAHTARRHRRVRGKED